MSISAALILTGMDDQSDILEDMTIEELAVHMANGFAELKEDIQNEFIPRFESIERKIDAMQLELSSSS